MKIHHNYLYLLEKIKNNLVNKKDFTVLDYGCGKGVLVGFGRTEGINIYGVEKFAAGSGVDIREEALNYGGGNIIKELTNEKIPFPDSFFDIVVSNTVFEHIPDLASVIAEIHRVLKPGGKLICIFPSKDAIREGHCDVPFVHWLSPGSKSQYLCLRFFKTLGFGRRKQIRDPDAWARYFRNWLLDNTFYLPYKTIEKIILEHFVSIKSLENDYISYRFISRDQKILSRLVFWPGFRSFFQWFCRSFGCHILICQKE